MALSRFQLVPDPIWAGEYTMCSKYLAQNLAESAIRTVASQPFAILARERLVFGHQRLVPRGSHTSCVKTLKDNTHHTACTHMCVRITTEFEYQFVVFDQHQFCAVKNIVLQAGIHGLDILIL